MHFKDNRSIGGGPAFAYDVGGGSGTNKIGVGGDATTAGRPGAGVGGSGGGGAAGGGPGVGGGGGGGAAAGGGAVEAEETLQDAILAEKVTVKQAT